MSLNSLQYKAGFLEEAAASGLSFINAPTNNPIASIKLCGPDFLVKEAYIANISISSGLNATLKFKCDVFTKTGNLLISHDDFDSNAAENIVANSNVVHGLVFASNPVECYLSYSVLFSTDYTSLPAGAKNSQVFYLSPFAIEPYVGDIAALKIRTDQFNIYQIDVDSLSAGNSRLLTFNEGYNYDLRTISDFEVPRLNFAATAGAGLGKEPCADVDLKTNAEFVTSINGVKPNDSGALTLTSVNACLALDPKNTQTNDEGPGILFASHCAPCCRCADYNKAGKFIRSYAATYAKMAKQYKELLDTYNSIAAKVKAQLDCCNTHNKMNTRFKVWPQQNFAVQVQGLMENNYNNAICLCNAELNVEVKMDTTITAIEEIVTDPSTDPPTTINITHTINAGDPLIITPMPEASYVYFKNVNPGNQVNVISESPGRLSVKTSLISDLPLAIPCGSNTSLPPTCMESCDGYLMLTAGFTIADPKFRRIMHVLQQNAENNVPPIPFDGIDVPLILKLIYTGTTANDPCANPCTAQDNPKILPNSEGARKLVKIAPNRKSVNPCAPVRLRNVTAESDSQGTKYYANFPDNTPVTVGSAAATLTVKRKAYIEDTQEWQDFGDLVISIPANTQITNSKILLEGAGGTLLSGIPSGAVGASFTVITTGENMTSKCFPDPNNNTPQNINIAPSSVTYTVRLT